MPTPVPFPSQAYAVLARSARAYLRVAYEPRRDALARSIGSALARLLQGHLDVAGVGVTDALVGDLTQPTIVSTSPQRLRVSGWMVWGTAQWSDPFAAELWVPLSVDDAVTYTLFFGRADDGIGRFQYGEGRVRELPDTPDGWLRTFRCDPVGLHKLAPLERTVRNCKVHMKVVCPNTWEGLTPTGDAAVRHCHACNEDVYYCATDAETIAHGRAGHCVARENAPSDVGPMVVGRPSMPNLPTPAQEANRRAQGRERGIDVLLRGRIDETTRTCPQCAYPVPEFRASCYVCGFAIGRA